MCQDQSSEPQNPYKFQADSVACLNPGFRGRDGVPGASWIAWLVKSNQQALGSSERICFCIDGEERMKTLLYQSLPSYIYVKILFKTDKSGWECSSGAEYLPACMYSALDLTPNTAKEKQTSLT